MKKVDVMTLISYSKVFYLCLVAFYSMGPYFFWGRPIILLLFDILTFCFFFLQHFSKINFEKNKFLNKRCIIYIAAFLIFYTYIYICWVSSLKSIITNFILFLFPVLMMLLCSDNEKKLFLLLFTRFIAVVFFVSLVFYFLYLAGKYKSYTKLYHSNEGYGEMRNYKFFIMCRGNSLAESIFPRFQSVLTEPGHLGMMSSLLLYANNYEIKRPSVLVLLISLLFSLSASGYALLVIGIILHIYFKSKKKIIALFAALFVGIAIAGGSLIYYNSYPDSVISKRIIHRFMPDKKRGIAGNNRNTAAFNKEYYEFLDNGGLQKLIGIGKLDEKFSWGNSSYKNFIWCYGLIGIFFILGFYGSIIYFYQTSLGLGMLLLWSISFLQRPYATWNSQIFIFVSAATVFKEKDKLFNSNPKNLTIKEGEI